WQARCSPSMTKGNTQPRRGTWGSPFGMLGRKMAERLNGAPEGAHDTTRRSAGWLNAHAQGQGDGHTRLEPGIYKAGNDCDASDAGLQGGNAADEGCADAMSAGSEDHLALRRPAVQ